MRWAFLFWFLLFLWPHLSARVSPRHFKNFGMRSRADLDCKPSQFPDCVLFTCERQYTFWYLTKPNHPAHPGIIKRYLYQQDGAWYAKEEGRSFASDAAQPAFKAWLAQIADMDRQAREWIKKQHSQEPDSKR